jgi:flagellin
MGSPDYDQGDNLRPSGRARVPHEVGREKPEPCTHRKKTGTAFSTREGKTMRIGHNMSAIFAHRQISLLSERLDKSIERLASGEHINRAGDDASGLAVSEKMRTQMLGLAQAERNAQNGLSFIQVAEGSLQHINDILQRIRMLSIQAANGIYSHADRGQIQVEVEQLIDEVDRISASAEFNRQRILTGIYARNSTTGSMFFHVGPNQDQRISAVIATMSARALNLVDANSRKASLSTVANANSLVGIVDSALDKLNRQRADLGAYYNRMEHTIRSLSYAYENMTAAYSRIRDADMASEMVEFTKNQVLIQSGIAMLAQANLKPQMILKLLG